MQKRGFIQLSRGFFSHWLWEEQRDYSKAEAWLDLIRMATFRDETACVQGRMLKLHKGDLVASARYLSTRWGWSRSKVERFLQNLQREAMIEPRNDTGLNIIKLCNYERYNSSWDSDEPPSEPATGPPASQSRATYEPNLITEERKEREGISPHHNAREAVELEVPTKEQALSMAERAGVPPDFAVEVWSDWHARNGRDAAGVIVPWPRYVPKRWQRERVEWQSGTHRYQKSNGTKHQKHTAGSVINACNTNARAASQY